MIARNIRSIEASSREAFCGNRIIMTPEHAKRLLNALMDNVTKYESQFGLIQLGGQPQQQGGTFNLGDLPQFGPGGAKS